jgi:ubiquinone/menaquinone biosynthesis C-methylase UbiE
MDEATRIQSEYARRDSDQRVIERYAGLDASNLYAAHSRERDLARLLKACRITGLSSATLLDVGCGGGGELARWIKLGVAPQHCHGIDLVEARIDHARTILPAAVNLAVGDASRLRFPDASFDLVLQNTVFTSILDAGVRSLVALEMLRVLKPNGTIVWYDFWINPVNVATRAIRRPELDTLFPNCLINARKITLAPPLARRVVPISSTLAALLDLLPLHTHILAAISKRAA